jgi:RNA polymerase sigma-70 factor (ECF subfamily)
MHRRSVSIDALVDAGRRAWPELAVDEAAVGQAVDSILGAQHLEDVDDLDAAEVWLAAACAEGQTRAIAAFRARYFDAVGPVVRQVLGGGTELVDEAWQALGEKLFVADAGGRPRVLQYAGTGRLGGLVRVSALRWALARRRQRRPDVELTEVVPIASSDPEGTLIEHEHRERFRGAMRDAAAALQPRARNLLRLHHLRGIGVAELARMYGVHRATMSRWLADARRALGDAVLQRMPADDEAAAALLQSQIDLSLGRLLATEP